MILEELKELQKYKEPVTKTNFHKENYNKNEIDFFVGISNPDIRKLAKKYYKNIDQKELLFLLTNKIHEYRLIALIMMTEKMKTKDLNIQKELVDMYLKHIEYVNNWDLVDLSAYKILGQYLLNINDFSLLYEMSLSKELWIKRISVVSTWILIKYGKYKITLDITDNLIHEEHDLLHKACGWMLREVGKKNIDVLSAYIYKHYLEMPRTMLRYAIERYPEQIRKAILRGDFGWM
jgi:3-methyladenine DNA glycosylase AlkD